MKKLFSALLAAALLMSLAPFAFAAHIHDAACGYKPASPCTHSCSDGSCSYFPGIAPRPCDKGCTGEYHSEDCGFFEGADASPCDHVHNAACGYSAGSPCIYGVTHICSYGIYDSRGDGTHTAICTQDIRHQIVKKCWSDNNNNHKCDHCGYVLSEHEFTYASEANFTHKAVCYCGIEFAEPCSFVDDRCEKCGSICRSIKLDADKFNAIKNDAVKLAASLGDSRSADILQIDNGSSLDFRIEVDKPALEVIRAENDKMGICVSSDSFSLSLGTKFLDEFENGFYLESRELDKGFAVELGSGDRTLMGLDADRISSHWGASTLRCSLSHAASNTYKDNTELFTLGLSGGDAAFASIATGLLEREKTLSKAQYTYNTESSSSAKESFDLALSDFSGLEQPAVKIKLAAPDATELQITGSEGSRYTLAPDADGIFETDMLLFPGRIISGYTPALGTDHHF